MAAVGDVESFNPNVGGSTYEIGMQPDGKFLVGGSISSIGGTSCKRLARLTTAGALDTSFSAPTISGIVYCHAVQGDGKIVIGGTFNITSGGVTYNFIARLNADGTLDTSFANTNVGSYVYTLAIQSDGKILAGGALAGSLSGYNWLGVIRLNVDGTIDTGFTESKFNGHVYSIALQANQKIIVGGRFDLYDATAREKLARLNTDGSLDTSFSNPAIGYSYVLCVGLDANEKILIGGNLAVSNSTPGSFREYVARINTDGTLDTTFSNPNLLFSSSAYVNSLSVQTDGKVIVGGNFYAAGSYSRPRLARLNSDGSVDSSFYVDVSGSETRGIFLQSDGKCLIAGLITPINGVTRNGVARLENNSATETLSVINHNTVNWLRGGASPEATSVTFDLSTDGGSTWSSLGSASRISGGWSLSGLSLPYGGHLRARARIRGGYLSGSDNLIENTTAYSLSGIVDTSFNASVNGSVYAIAHQSDGKILIGGNFTTVNSTSRNFLARLNADGTLDTGFTAQTNGSIYDIAIQSNGKIVICGYFSYVDSNMRNCLARLNTDGSLDTSLDIFLDDQASCLAIDSSDKITVGGAFAEFGPETRAYLGRVNADGSADTSFTATAGSYVNTLEFQSDGKLLLGGSFSVLNGTTRSRLGRLNTDDTLDTGLATTSSINSFVDCLARQTDNKILIGGAFTTIGGSSYNYLARIHTNGTVDSGYTLGANNSVRTMSSQSDGKVVIGGQFTTVGGTGRNYAARLNADGSLDTSFDPNPNNIVWESDLQSDGRILMGGDFTTVGGSSCVRISRVYP